MRSCNCMPSLPCHRCADVEPRQGSALIDTAAFHSKDARYVNVTSESLADSTAPTRLIHTSAVCLQVGFTLIGIHRDSRPASAPHSYLMSYLILSAMPCQLPSVFETYPCFRAGAPR